MQYAQIQVWRTRGFSPIVQEEPPPQAGTLAAPLRATWCAVAKLFDCLGQFRGSGHTAIGRKQSAPGWCRRDGIFSLPGRHFAGYAKIDRYYRPTRSDELGRLSMIQSDRIRADREAGRYHALSPNSRSRYAEQYLICLLDRGYSWQAIDWVSLLAEVFCFMHSDRYSASLRIASLAKR